MPGIVLSTWDTRPSKTDRGEGERPDNKHLNTGCYGKVGEAVLMGMVVGAQGGPLWEGDV